MDVRGLSYFHIFLLGTHLLEERGKIFSYLEIQCNTLTYKIIAFCVKVNTEPCIHRQNTATTYLCRDYRNDKLHVVSQLPLFS